MINLDTRLLSKCNEAEMWLLLHVAKRLGKKMFCFPSNNTLLVDTGWSIRKLRETKKSLQEKGLLEILPGRDGSTNIYRVTTDLIGVYISADRLSDDPSQKDTPSQNVIPPPHKKIHTPPSQNDTPKYYQSEVLTNSKGDAPLSIEGRKEKFWESLEPFVKSFGKDLVEKFFKYWTEMNDSKTKMKFEIERTKRGTFELSGRLATWRDNEEKFNFGKKPVQPATVIRASLPKKFH